jgi:recombinational DNA repair ATPase RecF
MIKSFEVVGLHGKRNYVLSFHSDMNILTGRNGSGKTTLLKMLWYCLSGNLDRLRAEVNFIKATLVTSRFTLTISGGSEGKPADFHARFESPG